MKKTIKLVIISASIFLAQHVLAGQSPEKPAEPASVVAPAVAEATSKININTADAATLAKELNGVGEVKAKAIVEYRTKNGPFKTIDDLANVDGIGVATIDKNKNKIVVQ